MVDRLLVDLMLLTLGFIVFGRSFLFQIGLETRRQDGARKFFGSDLLSLWCFMYDFDFLCAGSGSVAFVLGGFQPFGLVVRFAVLTISQRFEI